MLALRLERLVRFRPGPAVNGVPVSAHGIKLLRSRDPLNLPPAFQCSDERPQSWHQASVDIPNHLEQGLRHIQHNCSRLARPVASPEAGLPSAWLDAIGKANPKETIVKPTFSRRPGRRNATGDGR